MAMTLRLTDAEQAALRERADAEGISMQEAARRAVHRQRAGAVLRRAGGPTDDGNPCRPTYPDRPTREFPTNIYPAKSNEPAAPH